MKKRNNFVENQLKRVAQKFMTPLFLYKMERISSRFQLLENNLPKNFAIYYALKANGNLAICNKLAKEGCSADVSSLGELVTARKAGFKSILYTGPGKTDEEIIAAIKYKLKFIVVESTKEASRIDYYAQKVRVRQNVLLRINPKIKIEGIKLKMCGTTSKFGIDEENAIHALKMLLTLKNIHCQGIHIYTGSCILNDSVLLQSYNYSIRLANKLRSNGFFIKYIDLGGGIGVPYSLAEQKFNIERFGRKINLLIKKNKYNFKYILEVGRFLVAESGVYITKIVDIKESQGKTYLILDGGINNIFRISMAYANKLCKVIGKSTEKYKFASIAGPLCSHQDIFTEDIKIPANTQIGDFFVFFNCGAYAFSHSLIYFHLRPLPAEVASDNGYFYLIRKRGNAKDFFLNQQIY